MSGIPNLSQVDKRVHDSAIDVLIADGYTPLLLEIDIKDYKDYDSYLTDFRTKLEDCSYEHLKEVEKYYKPDEDTVLKQAIENHKQKCHDIPERGRL